ncbi:Putative hem oxygenase [Septoria linicola]|uniref:Hem oxygenase n=1 Tax=Septoria linicola TaxID=215465 RepID=A0A9Q9AL21_9PEZI|nr:putative hem oxygenase [Septoria linicola]USW49944.1 Putative hem oxygenase [Septoria linicola]
MASPMPVVSSTLGARINVATRKQHTELNRLLIQRLPLALPPNQNNPLLYSQGIVPFAKIFFFFETEWDLFIRHIQQPAQITESHDGQKRTWPANLRPQGLARSTRLQDDLKHLRAVAGPDVYNTVALGDVWMRDLRKRIRDQPHVLIAFAWVFYMAVFSGGRWIRSQLSKSGTDFWTSGTLDLQPGKGEKAARIDVPGYTFLSFDGDQDGEDSKAAFKARLAEAEVILSEEEQADIVEVAQELFARCNDLVRELDRKVMWDRMLGQMPHAFGVLLVLVVIAAWRIWSYSHDSAL